MSVASQYPKLSIVKRHVCGIHLVTYQYADFTGAIGPVTEIGNVVLVDIHVNVAALCYDRQQVGLVEIRINDRTRVTEKCFDVVNVLGKVNTIGAVMVDVEAIELVVSAIPTKNNSTVITVDNLQ